MKTFNNEYIRAYDKLKEDIFHSKKQQYKADLRSKQPKPSPLPKKTRLSVPMLKLTSLTTVLYLAYNYAYPAIDFSIKQNYFNVLDLISFKVLQADASLKIRTFFTHPQSFDQITHFSNVMFQTELQKDLNCLHKVYPPHTLKNSIESNFKIWIFQFRNFERSHYINQFGDLIEKQENSLLRIWRYPMFKNKTQKVVQEQTIHQYYRTLLQDRQTSANENERKERVILKQISKKCERINILNRFSPVYQQLLVQCRKNEKIGNAILQHLNHRKKLFSYPSIMAEPN